MSRLRILRLSSRLRLTAAAACSGGGSCVGMFVYVRVVGIYVCGSVCMCVRTYLRIWKSSMVLILVRFSALQKLELISNNDSAKISQHLLGASLLDNAGCPHGHSYCRKEAHTWLFQIVYKVLRNIWKGFKTSAHLHPHSLHRGNIVCKTAFGAIRAVGQASRKASGP